MTTTITVRTPLGVEILTHEHGEEPRGPLPAEGRPHPAHRLQARTTGEYLFVGLRGGTAAPAPQPLTLRLTPGDICFYDVRHAPVLDFPERFRATVFLAPANLLGLTGADAGRITRTPVARASRLGTLLSPLLSDLARAAAEARPQVGEMLAWNAVNLLSTLAVEQLGARTPDPASARPPVLTRILEYVELHLTDPELSPETIARAHHISVRYLHKLFKDEGTSVGRWILRRRLDECRRDLMRHGRGSRTIAAVAARWGFLSATHFSRVFRAAYGMSPSEWRDTAARADRRRAL
ncbi:helix-turn-helix domain-containing protein [Streptomyces griseoruber]|uniref:Transcriptional regulator n=1 Tax=Streptomyces griseoruber TaxID=1943 RepID=A0A117RE77_9ACTN|nr:helix-turn-helix domain-containing protein [Streptomyces griseoruber]KUN85918.1 transcriptional regulator [Streptomyces griseoruber]